MQKILIIRLSSIGDIILTTPLVRAVKTKYPDAEVSFLVKKEFYDVIKTNPHIDKFIVLDKSEGFPGLKKLKKQIQEQHYDLLIDIHKNFRSIYLRTHSKARQVRKYSKQIFKRTMLVKLKINLFKKIKPVYLRYFESVNHLGIYYDGKGTEVSVPVEDEKTVKKMLSIYPKSSGRKLAVICPGASFANKRWKTEGFAQVAEYLYKEKHAFICFAGGKRDVELCDKIAKTVSFKTANFAGKLSLLGSAALIKSAGLILTNDTGMMHLAQAQKRPVVAVFGPTTKELGYFPIPDKSVVVEKNLACRPCTHNGLNHCPKKHFACMQNISAEQVIKAINSIE